MLSIIRSKLQTSSVHIGERFINNGLNILSFLFQNWLLSLVSNKTKLYKTLNQKMNFSMKSARYRSNLSCHKSDQLLI